MVDPKMFRELYIPRLQRMLAPVREKGRLLTFHTDGDLRQVIPLLLELGFSAVHPVEPGCNDICALKREYAGRMAFVGNVRGHRYLGLRHKGGDRGRGRSSPARADGRWRLCSGFQHQHLPRDSTTELPDHGRDGTSLWPLLIRVSDRGNGVLSFPLETVSALASEGEYEL